MRGILPGGEGKKGILRKESDVCKGQGVKTVHYLSIQETESLSEPRMLWAERRSPREAED